MNAPIVVAIRNVVKEIVDEVLDSEELYDILPPDGQDDFIISELRRLFDKVTKEKIYAQNSGS